MLSIRTLLLNCGSVHWRHANEWLAVGDARTLHASSGERQSCDDLSILPTVRTDCIHDAMG